MKRKLWQLLILTAVIIVLSSRAPAALPPGYSPVQENEYLRLYLNQATAEFAVEEKTGGRVWFSTPPDLNLERIKRGNARNGMRSLIILNYFTPKREGKILNSYVDSVLNDEFRISISDDQVRLDFTLGKQWSDQAYYPVFIAKDKFEALLERVGDAWDKQILLDSYSLLSFEEREAYPYDKVTVFGLDLPQYFGNYEVQLLSGGLLNKKLGLRDEPHERVKYYLERLADTMVSNRADAERRGLLTAEDFQYVFRGPFYVLLDETYALYNRPEFTRIFAQLGYTPQDVAEDHRQHSIDPPRPNPQVFTVPLILRLEGPDLVATVPAGQIGFPVDIPDELDVPETYFPYSIDLLPYFGAAHQSSPGYLFVPERSGALIDIYNPKKNNLPAYSGYVYGMDLTITPRIEKVGEGAGIYLPVFGIKEAERAFFTIIEEGAALANIQAQSAGRTESFAKVFARYAITPRASITLYGVESSLDDKMVDAYAVVPYQGNITQRYTFLAGEGADYGGMANYYRQYLIDKHDLKRIDPASAVPLVVELIGGFHDVEPIFGAPREVIRPMTTYRQAQQILADLGVKGIESVRLRYLGWFKGGIEHIYPNKIVLEKALGTGEEFLALLDYGAASRTELYLDVDFNVVYRNTLFNGFRVGRDAARFLNRSAAKLWDYNLATFQRILEREAFIISPRVLDQLVDDFLRSFTPFRAPDFSLRRLGSEVFSDFVDKAERMVNREQGRDIAIGQLEKLRSRGHRLLIPAAHDGAIPYASQIIRAPTEPGPLLIIDRHVPFYQMVVHGYVDFAGQPQNVGGITRDKMLRCLETGELPFFRWAYGDSSQVKGTFFEYLLATNYHDLVEEGLAFYREVLPALTLIRGSAIIKHEQLGNDVFSTTYDNGVEIIVNYGEDWFWWDGIIPAKGYRITERGVAL